MFNINNTSYAPLAPNRESGSLMNRFYSKSFILLVIDNFKLTLVVLIFSNNNSLVSAVNGDYPETISYIIAPKVHQSAAFPWSPASISGAKYSAVPHLVCAPELPLTPDFESPKSISFK